MITFVFEDLTGTKDTRHGVVKAYDLNHSATHWFGSLSWAKPDAIHSCPNGRETDRSYQISYITVDPSYRRQGIATAMLQEARKHVPEVRQSMNRSPAGDAWARSTKE